MIGLAGVIGFQVFYFTLVIPFSKALTAGSFFWISYAIWGVIGLVMSLRKSKNDNRKFQNLFIVLFVILVGSVALSSAFPTVFVLFTLAFPGFCGGMAIAAILMLIKKRTVRQKKSKHDENQVRKS